MLERRWVLNANLSAARLPGALRAGGGEAGKGAVGAV